ncbi:pentapeptide repeat-containing protein [Nostoc sp.]|uniref:pentapeptide repeat-containing protein n=1 Tax=Nostoc sp. TaxID=1180 RepID=UPI002FFB333C
MPPDYSGQNFRGCSFKGQNLTGANFSGKDIRGANFTNAILKDADFTGAKAGLQLHWLIVLLIVAFVLLAQGVIYSISLGLSAASIFDTRYTGNLFIGLVCNIVVVVFYIVTFRKNLITGLGVIAVILVFVSPVVVILVVTFPKAFPVIRTLPKGLAIVFGLTISVASILFNILIGWRIQSRDDQDAWFDSVVNTFAATGGTSFYGANLINADFTGAILENTDFRKTNLTLTRFYEAKNLDFARVDDTILANRAVLNLLVTCNGRGKSYAGANLRGANLKDADLNKANLKGADIIAATFEGACLEWANLTITQAINTNFTSAHMTGACIEAWNIDSTTKLHNVDCRFIYLLEYPRLGTDDRERRPSSGEFQPGEFTKLFEEVLNTVDLIFRNGIDWKAFINAFQQVQVENEDTELAIQSIVNKDGVFVIRIKVPVDADKEKIHSDLKQMYQLALQEVEKYKALSQARYDEIIRKSTEMTNIVRFLAAESGNVQNFQFGDNAGNIFMTNSNDASRNINVGRDFNATGTINLGEISGAVTNTINDLPTSPEPEKPGIKELLTQLQAAIEADTNLLQEDKAEALEQVKALAEAGKSPQEGAMKKAAKTAIKILKGTISSLPTATKLVEQCSNLLPLISNFLGLG